MNYANHLQAVEAIEAELKAAPGAPFHADALTRCVTLKRSLNQARAAQETVAATQTALDREIAAAFAQPK